MTITDETKMLDGMIAEAKKIVREHTDDIDPLNRKELTLLIQSLIVTTRLLLERTMVLEEIFNTYDINPKEGTTFH